MAMTELDLDQPAYATELAKVLDHAETTAEITLSITDAKLAATALRHYASRNRCSVPYPLWGAAMDLFRAEKIATVQDQSNYDCRFCGGRLTLLKTMMESESGVVIHIFECGQCGERIWKD
jgi:hypothetical protein